MSGVLPHRLRHSYAFDLLAGDPEAGRAPAPLPVISKPLRHRSVAVTGRYLTHFERRDSSGATCRPTPQRFGIGLRVDVS
jgi:integrase